MTKKFLVLALSAMLFALCSSAQAQQPAKIPRIGFLSGSGDPNTPGFQIEAFRRGLQELGYIEGKNILVEYRYVEGKVERIPSLVAELVQLKVDVFISGNLRAIRAAEAGDQTFSYAQRDHTRAINRCLAPRRKYHGA
jgi:putative ABC transport system substrate-binding protein